MTKIPTAEEFFHSKYLERYNNVKEGELYPLPPTTESIKDAIEFTKLHVEATLKTAAESADMDTNFLSSQQEGSFGGIDKESILNSYPLTNIK